MKSKIFPILFLIITCTTAAAFAESEHSPNGQPIVPSSIQPGVNRATSEAYHNEVADKQTLFQKNEGRLYEEYQDNGAFQSQPAYNDMYYPHQQEQPASGCGPQGCPGQQPGSSCPSAGGGSCHPIQHRYPPDTFDRTSLPDVEEVPLHR